MNSEIELNFEKLNENILVYFQNNDESLDGAKELFASFIESSRQLENVKNIKELLALLKRRGLYSAFEFNTFRIFQKIIDDDGYLALVTRHQTLLKNHTGNENSQPNINKYAEKRNNQKESNDTAITNESATIPTVESVRNEIFNIIANGISNDLFRRLARHLDFTKEEIKDIELKCSYDYRTQNLLLLRMYEKRRNSITRLIKVLNLIEKPDLVRKINEVLNRSQ